MSILKQTFRLYNRTMILPTIVTLYCLLKVISSESCACATGNVHVRAGGGTHYHVVGTLGVSLCVAYKGDKVSANGFNWAHIEYQGQDAYIADNWLNFRDCKLPHLCACAKQDVNIRTDAGSHHHILGDLPPYDCLPYKNVQKHAGSLQWARVDYNGRDGWIATPYITIKECSASSSTSPQLPGCPSTVSRAQWHARAPHETPVTMPSVPQFVYIHHGSSASCHSKTECEVIIHTFQNYHMDSHGYNDIGYTFLIGEDGNVYEGTGWDKVGTHTKNHNSDGIGICFIGDFATHAPNAAAITAGKQLIKCAADNGKIRSNYVIKSHRDVVATTCPGQKLYELIKTWPHYMTSA